MIVHYYLKPNDNPYRVAELIRKYGAVPVFSRHTKNHMEQIDKDCRIHYDFKELTVEEFLESFH